MDLLSTGIHTMEYIYIYCASVLRRLIELNQWEEWYCTGNTKVCLSWSLSNSPLEADLFLMYR